MKKILIIIISLFLSFAALAKHDMCIDAYTYLAPEKRFSIFFASISVILIPFAVADLALSIQDQYKLAKVLQHSHIYFKTGDASQYPKSVNKLYQKIITLHPTSRITKSQFIVKLEEVWHLTRVTCQEFFSNPYAFIGDGSFPGLARQKEIDANRELVNKESKLAAEFRELENQNIFVADDNF